MINKIFLRKKIKTQPTVEEHIERGFAPQYGKIDILFGNRNIITFIKLP